jgi:hypothetical protein
MTSPAKPQRFDPEAEAREFAIDWGLDSNQEESLRELLARAVIASWTPDSTEGEKLVSPSASSASVPAPTKGAAAGGGESVRVRTMGPPGAKCGDCRQFEGFGDGGGRCLSQPFDHPIHGMSYGLAFAREGADGCDWYAPREGAPAAIPDNRPDPDAETDTEGRRASQGGERP